MTRARLRIDAARAPLGQGLLRIPFDRMADLSVQPGDTVSVTGTRKTHARVMPARSRSAAVEASPDVLRNAGLSPGLDGDLGAEALPVLREVVIAVHGARAADPAQLAEVLRGLALTEGDRIAHPRDASRGMEFEVLTLDPAPAGMFAATTALKVQAVPDASQGYEGVGGLRSQIARVHEMVATPLLRPDLFRRLGIDPPRGILFTGPPGSGKTLLARSVASRTSAAFFVINGPEILSKHYGESEAALRETFAAAQKAAPAIIFIDEIDSIAPRRESLTGERQVERRIVAQLLTLMDGLADRGQVVVLAATNQPDSIDPALRRPGRLDREITFTPPTREERQEILELHLRDAPLGPDADLAGIAAQCHGYVGADLAALAREAAMAALDRAVRQAGGEAQVDARSLFVEQADLLHGLQVTRPSALRDIDADAAPVTFDDVGGLEEAKRSLREAVIWPQKHRAAYAEFQLRAAGGVLLVGPPGSGKTLLARALAGESGLNFLPMRHDRLLSPYPGEAERALASQFAKARQTAPSLVFIDEIDALVPQRSGRDPVQTRLIGQFLTELDGLGDNDGIVVVAATNRPDALDPALIRPGRFDTVIRLDLPDLSDRRAICRVICRSIPMADEHLPDRIAERTEGLSAAALAGLIKAAARFALRRWIEEGGGPTTLRDADLDAALQAHHDGALALAEDFTLRKAHSDENA